MRGMEFHDLTDEIVADHGERIEKAHAKAEDLNKRLGLDLTWRDILVWPMPDGVQISIGPPAQQQQQAPAKGKPPAGAAPERNDEPGQNRLLKLNGNGVLTHGN